MSIMKEKALVFLRSLCNDENADFRDGQWDAIESVINRKRLLLVRRTGWGKSAVYFIATKLLREIGSGPTLLISPLLALMRNQIEAARRIGIRAYTINSANKEEWDSVQGHLKQNNIDVLLISPERLGNEDFVKNYLATIASNIGLFVIDEAHCISDWGHDFRPDYRRIVRILRHLPENVSVLSTTATANDRVVDDIREQIGQNLIVSRGPLVRTSLRLQNINLPEPSARMAWLADHLPSIPGTGIIYTLTVRDSIRLAEWLQTRGIDAIAYFSKVPDEERKKIEQDLFDNKVKVVVATTALSMGIDKPDIGFVIHYQRPGSVVHYYQQVGRAGRVIENAYGILFCGREDDDISQYFIDRAFPPQKHVDAILKALSGVNGLTMRQLESKVNVPYKKLDGTLHYLLMEDPSPVIKKGTVFFRTPVHYELDLHKIEKITMLRYEEQKVMQEYMKTDHCLMEFLAKQLNDPHATACQQCSNCRKTLYFRPSYSQQTAIDALNFLKRSDIRIESRSKWMFKDAFPSYGFSGPIKEELKAQEGRCLCVWGDPVWGQLVKEGKQKQGVFDIQLVDAAVELIRERWKPSPFPKWVTSVPSLRHPSLVPDFACKVAERLGLVYVESLKKTKNNFPQKEMHNSYYQASNLDGAFDIIKENVYNSPVLLIDDMVDSKWTFTVIAALLRQNGSGPVWPFALAMTSHMKD